MSEEIVRDTVFRIFGILDVFCDGFVNMLDPAQTAVFRRLLRCVWRISHICELYLLARQIIIPTQMDQKVDDSENR